MTNLSNEPTPRGQLEKKLNTKSFKVRPIFLEFPNYNYFHTASHDKENDAKERFVGRKKIINKILSFVHETTSNTGAYLITGFRGMGKTSVVNKALSSLNTNSKNTTYFAIWLLLMPMVVFWENMKNLANQLFSVPSIGLSLFLLLMFLTVFVFVIFALGYQDGRNERIVAKYPRKSRKLVKFKNAIRFGIIAFFNPKFARSKHSFHKNLRSVAILGWTFLIILFCCHTLSTQFLSRHQMFWFITGLIVLAYLCIDIYTERLEYIKYKGTDDYENEGATRKKQIKQNKIALVTGITMSVIIYLAFYIDALKLPRLAIAFLAITILLTYTCLKATWIRRRLQQNPNTYIGTLTKIRALFDWQHHVVIRVNLGKDNLTEKEVLKFITNELLREYRKWYFNIKSLKRFTNIVLLTFLLYLFFTSFYRGFLGNRFTDFSVNTLRLDRYFPSQRLAGKDNLKLEHLDFIFDNGSGEMNLEEYNNELTRLENDSLKEPGVIGFKELETEIFDLNRKTQRAELFNKWLIADTLSIPDPMLTTGDRFHISFAKLCNELDYLALKLWHSTRMVLLDYRFENQNSYADLSESPYLNRIVNKVYPKVPIFAVFFFMVLLLFSLWLLPSRFRYIKGHTSALRELIRIKNQIDASMTFEQSGNATALKSSWYNIRRRYTYQPLDAKDISQKLIHLLDDIHELPFFFIKAKFVVVFDELDKISPHSNNVISSKEDEFEADNSEVRYQTRRKERIALILSSMKHFLNSAKAKFIFIAGREMYDAALAGISDRESSLDSIFNDNKIYVNSFYTEQADNNLSDLTSITEQYLCQFLIPEYFLTRTGGQPSLKTYRKYLEVFFKEAEGDEEIRNLKINKITAVLKDFVLYLTYRSNGAPRKLSNLVEQYLVKIKDKDLVSDKILYVGNTDENLYLDFGYYNQYKFSLISYLATPVFLGIGNYMHEYSDKLLVSISYMLDHLYKFHKFGLSYRSLSLTPEIVDVNKEPQFREFLDKMVQSLSKNHLRPILSGIYDFKFNGKIASEIRFLSKIDELEGAAFNFTLDESIELKRHFNRRLEQLTKIENQITIKYESEVYEDHVNSTSMLNVMIGDLHFYDEEYQEAIIHYMQAIQTLRQKESEDMNLYDFVLFVRNKLKLGLAFEKNKMYDNALMTYSELSDLVLKKRNIPLKKFGLARFVITKNCFKKGKQRELKKKYSEIINLDKLTDYLNDAYKNEYPREIMVIGRLKASPALNNATINKGPLLKRYHTLDEMGTYYVGNDRELVNVIERLSTNYKPIKHYFSLSTGENIRILYQPLIAKLHLIEKSSPDKLTDIDLIRAIHEFNFLKLPLNTKEKRVVVSEFYNKIGDLLYFKNGTLNRKLLRNIAIELKDENTDQIEKIALRNLMISPIDSLIFYIKSLSVLVAPCANDNDQRKKIKIENYYKGVEGDDSLKDFFEVKVSFNLKRTLKALVDMVSDGSYLERYSVDYLNSICNGIIDLADTLDCFAITTTNSDSVSRRFAYIHEAFKDDGYASCEVLSLKLYHTAHLIYDAIGEHHLAKSQLLKVVYIVCRTKFMLFQDIHPDLTEESLFQKCLRLTYDSYEQTYHLDIKKITEIVKQPSTPSEYRNSLAMAEIHEVVSLHWMYKFKTCAGHIKFYEFVYTNINPFSTLQRKQNRILELHLRLLANRTLFEKFSDFTSWNEIDNALYKTIDKAWDESFMKNEENHLLIKQFLTLDSLGACNELLKTHYLFDIDYITTNNLSLAKAHYIMAYWCKEYDEILKQDRMIEEVLGRTILNSETLMYINEIYHLNLALQFNKKANGFHSNGEPLATFVRSASYLDDFFNDKIVHFLIAQERNAVHEINRKSNLQDFYIKKIENRINELGEPYKIASYDLKTSCPIV